MFKILSTYICWKKIYIKCNIWRVAVRPSYIEDARFLKVKAARPTARSITEQTRSNTQVALFNTKMKQILLLKYKKFFQ